MYRNSGAAARLQRAYLAGSNARTRALIAAAAAYAS